MPSVKFQSSIRRGDKPRCVPGDLPKATTGAASVPPAVVNHKVGPSGVPSTIIPSGRIMKSPPPSTIASRVSHGTVNAPEQASVAHSSVKQDLADAKPSPDDSAAVSVSAVPDPVQVALPEGSSTTSTSAEKKKKSETKSERDLPLAIGTLDTPEEASTPHISVRKDRDDAEPSLAEAGRICQLGGGEAAAMAGRRSSGRTKTDFDPNAIVPAKVSLGAKPSFVPHVELPDRRRRSSATSGNGAAAAGASVNSTEAALGADEVKSATGLEVAGEFHMSGKFVTSIHWNPSSSAEEINALFDAAKTKALEHVHVDKS